MFDSEVGRKDTNSPGTLEISFLCAGVMSADQSHFAREIRTMKLDTGTETMAE